MIEGWWGPSGVLSGDFSALSLSDLDRLTMTRPLYNSLVEEGTMGVFAPLVRARVFKTRGGCEQRPQSVRFRYTPVDNCTLCGKVRNYAA